MIIQYKIHYNCMYRFQVLHGRGPQRSCLTQHQKYHKSHIVAVELASLSSEVGMTEFTRRYTLLQTLRDIWASGRDAILCAGI